VIDGDFSAVAIDMPIGMPNFTPRASEIEARRHLSPRGSTIFPTPVRACLAARDYAHACELSMAARGVKISKQSWHILDKIREVDNAVTPAHSGRVIEAHPECSFLAMNGGVRLPTKHSAEGIEVRAALVTEHFGVVAAAVRTSAAVAKIDDVLDAYAVLWTAERFVVGAHRSFPAGAQEFDARGLPMRIVV